VEFSATLTVAYRACLESRVASRVFLVVAELDVPDEAQFYEAARAIDWRAHIDPARTLACDFTGKHPTITHTRFGSLRLKDAICDQLRDVTGRRPDISPERPAVRVHAHANGPKITVSLDLSGEGLHRRGYRTQAGEGAARESSRPASCCAPAGRTRRRRPRSSLIPCAARHAGHRGRHDRGRYRAVRAGTISAFLDGWGTIARRGTPSSAKPGARHRPSFQLRESTPMQPCSMPQARCGARRSCRVHEFRTRPIGRRQRARAADSRPIRPMVCDSKIATARVR
jgi:hypothetical protein